jgi:hypothetical protein
MRTSCIEYPASDRFVMIRKSFVQACTEDGKPNHCAAALLSFFVWQHDAALAELDFKDSRGGKDPAGESNSLETAITAQQSPFLRASIADLEGYLLGLYSRHAIEEATELLQERRFIDWRVGSPDKRRSTDRCRHYQLDPEALNTWLFNQAEKEKSAPIGRKSPMDSHRAKKPYVPLGEKAVCSIGRKSPMIEKEGEEKGEEVKTQPASAVCLAPEPLTLVGEPEPAKPPKPKPQTPQTVPGVSAFLAQWRTRFEAVKHAPCMMHYGRDGSAAKRLLAGSGLSAEALLGIAERAWVANGKTFWCKQSVTVAGFAGRFTEIAAELDVKLDKGNVIEDEPEAWAYSQPPAGVMEGVAR